MFRRVSGVLFSGVSILQHKDKSSSSGGGGVLRHAAHHWCDLPLVFAQEYGTPDGKQAKEATKFGEVKAAMPSKQVVLVTGGAGFLGQHVVKLLQEKADFVKEIRVLDVKPYENKLGHSENKPVGVFVGSLCDSVDVQKALKGVDAVIHTAGVVSFGVFPDYDAMERVNVNGTANLIEACISENVQHLVFTSTIDVVIGFDEIENGDEDLPIPSYFLFPGYPDTKSRAERMVLQANGAKLDIGDGSFLSTVSLRPNVMYGEGDPYYIPSALKGAAKSGGTLPKIGNGEALFQQAYVGNMAWAHVTALAALHKDPHTNGGHVFFITDDTPVQNSFAFMEPFLKARSFSLASYSIPYPLIYTILLFTENFLKLISPIYKYKMDTALCSIIYMNKTFFFNRAKAEKMLGYKPLYTLEQSMENSMEYYLNLDL